MLGCSVLVGGASNHTYIHSLKAHAYISIIIESKIISNIHTYIESQSTYIYIHHLGIKDKPKHIYTHNPYATKFFWVLRNGGAFVGHKGRRGALLQGAYHWFSVVTLHSACWRWVVGARIWSRWNDRALKKLSA